MEPNVNNKDLRDQYLGLIRIAYQILFVQNLLVLGSFGFFLILGSGTHQTVTIGIYIAMFIDLAGFLLLAWVYLLYSLQTSKGKWFYLGGGLGILGWCICRIGYQYIIFSMGIPRGYFHIGFIMSFFGLQTFFGGGSPPSTLMVASFLMGGFSLGIGSILIWCAEKKREELLFMIYGISNLITVFLIGLMGFPSMGDLWSQDWFLPWRIRDIPATTISKGLIVPLLGFIAFYLLWRRSKSALPPTTYLAGIPTRFAAFMIDFLIIRIIHDNLYYVVWMAFFSGTGNNLPAQLWYSFPYIPFSFGLIWLLLPLDLVYYFFPPLLIINPFLSIPVYFTGIILAFGYFFIFGAFFDGRTIGKIVLNIKSVSGKEDRSLTLKEATIDALAKSFFLAWDVIIGAITWDERKQIRLVHRLMEVEVINTKYVGDQLPGDHMEKEENKFCPTCGQTIPIISRHCPYCGVALEHGLGE